MNYPLSMNKWVCITLLMVTSMKLSAMTCHVEETGTGWGTSWSDTTQLLYALGEPTCETIWVKQGTYKPTRINLREESFVIDRPLALYGGFAGNEISLNQRDVINNPTILSGDIGTVGVNTDNSYHVIVIDNSATDITNTTVIDGFDVVDGYTTTENGGGLTCADSQINTCAPTLRHMNFINNHAENGGAIYGYTGNVDAVTDFQFVSFVNNHATDYGGAIYLEMSFNDYNTYMEDVTFSQNSSDISGSGIYYKLTEPFSGGSQTLLSLLRVDFIGNAAGSGGTIYSATSGEETVATLMLDEVRFHDNTAEGSAAAMFSFANASSLINTIINDSEFMGNQSGFDGGAINNYDTTGISSLIINDSAFINNHADRDAGAINNFTGPNSSMQITNTTFVGNTADNEGGAIWHGAFGAGPEIRLSHVTFSQNAAAVEGGAMFNFNTANTVTPTAINNTIMWGNTAPASSQLHNELATAAAMIDDSIIEGGCPLDSACTAVSDLDPLLGTLGYYGGFSQTLPLQHGSPAIDTADNTECPAFDQRGMTRPADGDGDGFSDCDMGAFELREDLIFMDGFE